MEKEELATNLLIWFETHRRSFPWRNGKFNRFLIGISDHRNLGIPKVISDSKYPYIHESFINGYFDIRTRLSPSDREGGIGKIRLDVSISGGSPELAVQICSLLQTKLNVPVEQIHWGTRSGGREHIIRVYPEVIPHIFFHFLLEENITTRVL